MGDSLRYGAILIAGLPVTMAYNLLSCLLRALGDSKTPLQAILVSSAVNIAADCACILALSWGVGVAAEANVVAWLGALAARRGALTLTPRAPRRACPPARPTRGRRAAGTRCGRPRGPTARRR